MKSKALFLMTDFDIEEEEYSKPCMLQHFKSPREERAKRNVWSLKQNRKQIEQRMSLL